ncbi:MAG: rod shape-determining protein MreD [Candidatus Syntrophonatronum acetioxidans]|uniref:Rod shape-determining protein MreD n=1 Tax=Candidatus Syntrophonatronum acetioxidans TaxID=1795816 RepID=A0A424YII5_9FIRM|nr:MAG: rod shape-determining protein MreD [Candidatus Syntrophonatronum acetioxidans]
MAKIKIFIIIILTLIIQGSLYPFLNMGRGQPDLVLILVVCFSILWGSRRGAVIGLGAGFLQDILYGHALGLFALTKMLVGYFSGFTEKNIYKDFVLGPMIIAFILTFLHEGLVFVFSREIMYLPLINALNATIFPRALYHFCLTPFAYLFFYYVNKRSFFYPFQ